MCLSCTGVRKSTSTTHKQGLRSILDRHSTLFKEKELGCVKGMDVCGDYKLTVNQAAEADTYPLPRIEDLFASLSGGKSFTKLAYQQVKVADDSKCFTTVNTHKGLYQYTLPIWSSISAISIPKDNGDHTARGYPMFVYTSMTFLLQVLIKSFLLL